MMKQGNNFIIHIIISFISLFILLKQTDLLIPKQPEELISSFKIRICLLILPFENIECKIKFHFARAEQIKNIRV